VGLPDLTFNRKLNAAALHNWKGGKLLENKRESFSTLEIIISEHFRSLILSTEL
jgi:hypothetical protein